MRQYLWQLRTLSLPLLVAACAETDVAGFSEADAPQAEALSMAHAVDVPDALKVPQGHELAFVTDAEGAQVYVCQAGASGTAPAWTLERPDALLFGKRGRVVGHHYEGPTWEGLDGSSVVGKRLDPTYTPDPTAIPWLLLQAKSTSGDGVFSNVTYIQRLHTDQGLAPEQGCDAENVGKRARRPYTAAYYFYHAAKSGKPERH